MILASGTINRIVLKPFVLLWVLRYTNPFCFVKADEAISQVKKMAKESPKISADMKKGDRKC